MSRSDSPNRIEEAILDTAAKGSTAYYQRFYFERVRFVTQTEHTRAYEAIISKAVPGAQRKYSCTILEAAYFFHRAPPKRQIELIRSLRQLSNAGRVMFAGVADCDPQIKIGQESLQALIRAQFLFASCFLLNH
ncbi:MAG: hypothetical protein JWO80_1303 [Bryobacterales bacterium]|nr:hypothetical protein [Bryobacterales bacterium]